MRKRRLGLQVDSKVWIEDADGNYLFGYGIASILEGIERLGSISAVAAERERSYRYIWGRIRNAEEILGVKLVETTIGGQDQRRSHLTDHGRRWLQGFTRVRAAVKKAASTYFDKHLGDF